MSNPSNPGATGITDSGSSSPAGASDSGGAGNPGSTSGPAGTVVTVPASPPPAGTSGAGSVGNPGENGTGSTLSFSAGDGEITIDMSKGEKAGAIDLTGLLSQAAAGLVRFEIVEQPLEGQARLAGATLTYTPSDATQRDKIRYVAIHEGVRSSPATVSVRVLRASLTGDPTLTDLTRAQLDIAAAVGLRQLDNIAAHLEGSSWDDRCVVRNRVMLRSARPYPEEPSRGAPSERVNSRECKKAGVLSAWTAGTVTVDDEKGRASTDGLTAGLEAALGSTTIVGFTAGLSRSRYELENRGSVRLSSASASAYGAWRPSRAVQIAGAVGYADLDLHTRRQLGGTANIAAAKRNGHALFATIEGSADFALGKAVISSYGRASVIEVDLKGNSEGAQLALAIDNGSVDQRQFEGTFGATVRYPVPLARGVVTPFARLEGRWHTAAGFVQDVVYRDTPAEPEYLTSDRRSNSGWLLGAGTRYEADRFSLMAEYRLTHGRNWANGTVRIEASVHF